MELKINSEVALGALLQAGAVLREGESWFLDFDGRSWEVNPKLARRNEYKPAIKNGWVGYRVVVETWAGLRGAGVVMRPISREFILKTDAELLLARDEFLTGLDPDVSVAHHLEEIDVPWQDFYWRAYSILQGVNRTLVKRMKGDVLASLADDIFGLAYGVVDAHRITHHYYSANLFGYTLGDEDRRMPRSEFVEHIRHLKHAAISRIGEIKNEVEV